MTDIELGRLIDGRYKALSRLGSGGMADVYLAEDEQLGRKIALKLLHRRFAVDPGFVERFRREAQAAAALQHPNVVSTYDRGEFEGTYYIAMEYLPGRSLKQLIRQEAPLEPVRAIDIAVQILKAARFAHRRGVIHRDLKPHNVIVDDSDHAKVTDFGIARAGASDMTETGSIMGTAQYLSPEQAQGLSVSEASDLYSIAVVLYEMLTARVPFDGDSAVTIALKHVSEAPAPPRTFNPSIPPDLEQVVLWALNKRPEDRPRDADQLIAVLERVRHQITSSARGAATANVAAIGGELVPALVIGGSPEETDAAEADRHLNGGNPVYGEVVEGEAAAYAAADRRRRRVWPWLLGIFAVLLIAGGGTAVYLLTRPAKATVPPVVNESVSDATTILSNDNFTPSVIPVTSTSPDGTVVAQSPLGGVRVKTGSIVTLKVSSGPGQTTVPQLAGMSKSAATEAIEKASLKLGDTLSESSSTVPVGDVTGSDPAYPQSLAPGSKVTLYISSGRAPVAVPYVIGDSAGAATAALKALGLQVSELTAPAPSAQVGDVTSQTPDANVEVPPGSTVTIEVAAAPTTAQIPNVVGFTASAATSTLSSYGFSPKPTIEVVKKSNEDGIVIKQSPSGGTAAKGTTVTIVVGKYQSSTTTTTTKTKSSTTTSSSTSTSSTATSTTSTPPSTTGP